LKPVLLVVAGPNGAGKTTVTARLRAERWSEGVEYLNPDEVARDRFGDWNSPAAVLKAAEWTSQRREELLAPSDPRINAARVADRVLGGGHAVPIEKILARHVRAVANLGAVIAVADRVYVYDNSLDAVEARLCARTQDGLLRKVYGTLPQWIADAVNPLARHPDFIDMGPPKDLGA
jgi:predicted ABC-type ATPase